MSEESRRLAAIVFTDIVGYTALAQRDEKLAMQLLDKHNLMVRSALEAHSGREVKTIGDAFLLEFGSALEAVLFAVDVQTAFRTYNFAARSGERVLVRIGIHVGDVIHKGGDVLGDAVNVASRIVRFSEGGGVSLSDQVYGQVRNKVNYQAEKLAAQKLKNVELEMDVYRLILPWEDSSSGPAKGPVNRIAVLPFTNISPDRGDTYFADGLTEELISALSEIKGFRVIARTSVNRYKDSDKNIAQIGNELQVSHLLEGSVRKEGSRIRITTHLVDSESQEEVWSARYDKDLVDVFSIQNDIASSVANSLKVKLLAAERTRIGKKETESVAAYVAYLKGRVLLREGTEAKAKEAREQFELALREDDSYAKAYSGLADTHMLLGDYMFAPVPQALEEANKCVNRALELDPNLAEARVSLANLLMYDLKFQDAEREFRRAIEANPSYATGHHWHSTCLLSLGRLKEGLEEILLAEELDPLSPAITLSAVYRLLALGTPDEVERRIRKLERLDPGSPLVDEAKMVYNFAKGDWDRAQVYLSRMMEADPDDPYLLADLAYIYAVTGRRDDVPALVKKLETIPEGARVKGQLLAFTFVGLGDLDRAFEWVQYALAQKEFFMSWVRWHPVFEPLRKDPRFAEVLKAVGLPS